MVCSDLWTGCHPDRLKEQRRNKPVVIAAVIFDLDGLTVDSEPVYRRAWQRAAASLGLAFSDAIYEQAFVGRSNADCDREVAKLYPACDLSALRAARDHYWYDIMTAEGIQLRPGVLPLLAWLKTAQIPVAIATASCRAEAELSLKAAGVWQCFDRIFTADDVDQTKPASDVYLKAVASFQAQPADCIALEDSVNGATAALAAGLRTIVIPDLQQPTATIAARAYAVLPSLTAALSLLQDLAQASSAAQP